jgi:hypothetical protein
MVTCAPSFGPDDAAADDGQPPRHLRQGERLARPPDVLAVHGEAGELDGLRASRDDEAPRLDPEPLAAGVHLDGRRGDEGRAPADHLHAEPLLEGADP